MIILNVQQGTPEWHALRATHDCASEAAAALGLSKNCTRSELMKIKHTGIAPDVSGWTQKFLFDKGHEVEAIARPIVAKILGEALHPVTGESDDGKLLASLDGFTMFGDTVWENKMMNTELWDYIVANNDLPDTHWPQCEHQLLVTEADRVYFTLSDGTEEGTPGIFYESKPERRQRLIAGWAMFNEELAAYVPEEVKPSAVAEVIEDLPALTVQLVGNVASSNLPAFQKAVLARIQAINTNLVTDKDFATADKMVKFLDDGEKRLDLVKAQALAQTSSINELFRTIDGLKAEMRSKRLTLDKLVKAEKDNRKSEIVSKAREELVSHIEYLHRRIGVNAIKIGHGTTISESIKGLKSLDSMRDKVSVALANAKIEANAIADLIEANKRQLIETDSMSLFPDFAQVCTKYPEDFDNLLSVRVDQRKADEEKRLESERENIRAEEQVKAEAKARAEAQAAATKIEAERMAALPPVVEVKPHHIEQPLAMVDAPVVKESLTTDKTIKLGEISQRLGFTVTADFLASLGFEVVATDKNAKLYRESSFHAICRALVRHINDVATGTVRLAA